MLADLNATVKDEAQKLADTIDAIEIKDQKSFAKMIQEKRDAMIKNHLERMKKHFEEMKKHFSDNNRSEANNTNSAKKLQEEMKKRLEELKKKQEAMKKNHIMIK